MINNTWLQQPLFQSLTREQKQIIDKLPLAISCFIEADNFYVELADLNKNCSNIKTYQTRFFHTFNAFKVMKYLNFAHEKYFQKAELALQIAMLKKAKTIGFSEKEKAT